MLYMTLTIIGGIVGLVVTGAAFYTVWIAYEANKRLRETNVDSDEHPLWRRWTVMDYAALGLFAIGALFMFSDLLAIMRDRHSYPFYHYGYLFIAFIFMLIGMLFMVVRLGVILRNPSKKKSAVDSSDSDLALHDNHDQPDQANHS
jgi:hypothetical protein